jgi:CO/xanthine dehydrogenase Mo-binding subunit
MADVAGVNGQRKEFRIVGKPTILDIAPTQMDLLEIRAGNAAYGANGISHSLANTHLVICAIHNAIGKWVDPPATPDKVLKALGKA